MLVPTLLRRNKHASYLIKQLESLIREQGGPYPFDRDGHPPQQSGVILGCFLNGALVLLNRMVVRLPSCRWFGV